MRLSERAIQRIEAIFADVNKYEYKYRMDLLDAIETTDYTDNEKIILSLCAKAISPVLNSDNIEEPFSSMIVMSDGSRSINLSDFDNDDLVMLEELAKCDLPTMLASRINDLLWVCRKKHVCASNAISYYIQLSGLTFDPEEWTTCANYIRRANIIALQFGKGNNSFETISEYIDKKTLQLDGLDPLFLSLILIEIQANNGFDNFIEYIRIVDRIISNAVKDNDNVNRIEEAFKTKELLPKKHSKASDIIDNLD